MGARFLKDGRFFSGDTAFCGQDDSQEDQNGLCFDVFSSDQSTRSCRVGNCQPFWGNLTIPDKTVNLFLKGPQKYVSKSKKI